MLFPSYVTDYNIIKTWDQLQLWSWFLGYQVNEYDKFCNPLRVDNHPGCWLEWSTKDTGWLVLIDYADRRFLGFDILSAISYQRHCTKKQALYYIIQNFKPTHLTKQQIIKQKNNFVFRLHSSRRKWEQKDADYWVPYDIHRNQLESDLTFPVKEYIMNSKKNPNFYHKIIPDLAFCYPFNNHQKIYMPYEKHRFITSCDEDDIGGIDKLVGKKILIITKSYKDYRVLKNIAYDVIWFQNEGCLPNPFLLSKIIKEYDYIFVLYDNDKAGIKASRKVCNYYNEIFNTDKFIPTALERELNKVGITDPADFIKEYGKQELISELKNML